MAELTGTVLAVAIILALLGYFTFGSWAALVFPIVGLVLFYLWRQGNTNAQ